MERRVRISRISRIEYDVTFEYQKSQRDLMRVRSRATNDESYSRELRNAA